MIDIWQIGNNGVRNPLRLQDAFRVYSESNMVGKIRGRDVEINFGNYLAKKDILSNKNDKDGTYGRKFRFLFNINGLTYRKVDVRSGYEQADLGPIDEITPFGRKFLQASTVPAVQECFLRAMSMKTKKIDDNRSFSPLCWTLAVMLKLEEISGSSSISFMEFAVCVQTSSPMDDIDQVVLKVLEIRTNRLASKSKRIFDRQSYNEFGKHYSKKTGNFSQYADMNLKYLRATGIFQRKGRGISIAPEKHTLAKQLSSDQINTEPLFDLYHTLCTDPTLPTDNINIAKDVLNDLLDQMTNLGIPYNISDVSLDTVTDVNNVRHSLESMLSKYNEQNYADNQRFQWQEIYDYMGLVMKRGGTKEYDDSSIQVLKEECAAYFEWVIWRAFLAIDHLVNKPYDARRFDVDQDFFPVNTAPGYGPDMTVEFEDCVVVIEVTLTESSRQEAMEGEPVRRHVADLVKQYDNKPVYGLFIANRVDSNTAETFRIGVWYTKEDERLDLKIVPFTLAQFRMFFKAIFINDRATPQAVVSLITACEGYRRDCEAPEWKQKIESIVTTHSRVTS